MSRWEWYFLAAAVALALTIGAVLLAADAQREVGPDSSVSRCEGER